MPSLHSHRPQGPLLSSTEVIDLLPHEATLGAGSGLGRLLGGDTVHPTAPHFPSSGGEVLTDIDKAAELRGKGLITAASAREAGFGGRRSEPLPGGREVVRL